MKNAKTDKANFKKNLAHLMTEKQCTQDDIARSIGVSPAAVSHWCIGVSLPRGETLLKLATYFSVSPSTLLGNNSVFSTMEEEALLSDFRMLSPKGRKKALERMHELKQLYWYEKAE